MAERNSPSFETEQPMVLMLMYPFSSDANRPSPIIFATGCKMADLADLSVNVMACLF